MAGTGLDPAEFKEKLTTSDPGGLQSADFLLTLYGHVLVTLTRQILHVTFTKLQSSKAIF